MKKLSVAKKKGQNSFGLHVIHKNILGKIREAKFQTFPN